MFTGLIESVGVVRSLRRAAGSAILSVAAPFVDDSYLLGESIAVNGACLTVVAFGAGGFQADVSPETLACTNLAAIKAGQPVNLERALRLGDRLGGHIVSGHIDAVATLAERRNDGNAQRMTFTLDPAYNRFLVAKGSVAIDGISLTVNSVDVDSFTVAIIPHSLQNTTLATMKIGSQVNIETDLIAKYVLRLFPGGRETPPVDRPALSLDFLAKHGFL
ncbi:MAG: riboflavin synthase [Desulfuromonadales bacterium]|nr:riboflavin synthase [Desulfuromonadales bacterium]